MVHLGCNVKIVSLELLARKKVEI
ncbi:hypothetical protein EMIT0P228_20608 [Pseudomonas brassicacearum]